MRDAPADAAVGMLVAPRAVRGLQRATSELQQYTAIPAHTRMHACDESTHSLLACTSMPTRKLIGGHYASRLRKFEREGRGEGGARTSLWGRPDAASRLRMTCRMRSMCFSSALMLLEPPPAPPAELELLGPSPLPPPVPVVPPVPVRGMLPRVADSDDRTFVLPRGVRFVLPALVVLWSELRLFWDILACTGRGVASMSAMH